MRPRVAAPAKSGVFSMIRTALLAAILASTLCGQAAYKAPRTWNDQPDLQGIWQVMNTANDSLEPHTAVLGMPAGLGVIVDPPDGKIPYKPEALAQRDENFKNRATADPVNRCWMPGVPRLTYLPFPLQIFQSKDHILIASEYVHTYRTIFINGTKHLDGVDFYDGDSRGHWEGDTLVVDVAGFNDQTWFDRSGNYHSEQLHVVERYTRTGPDVLMYEATIEDPKLLTRPFKISMPLHRHTEPNFRLLEYECHAYMEDANKAGSR
jgi:hypothetical protein